VQRRRGGGTAGDEAAPKALNTPAREQAELFEAAFKYAGIGMALVGLDGGFLRLNDAFCRITGYSEAALLALDFQAITHADDLDADLGHLARLNAGLIGSYQMDKRYLRKDGSLVWVRLTASMVRTADGSPKHYVAQVQDLTEQRAAEAALTESETRYRLIADNSSDLIVMSRLTGEVTYVSPSVRSIGWGPGDLVGRDFGEQMQPDDAKAVSRAFGKLLQGEDPGQVRWRGRHGATGEWMWMESHPTLLRDPQSGEPTGFVDVVRDITGQVLQEQALAEARIEAEAALAVKAQFLANMSHEIRTPLTAVLGFTSLLREDPSVQGAAAAYVERIAGAGAGLLAIVNDVLDFSKLEAGKFEIRPQPTRLAALCEETLMIFSGQAEAKGLTLAFEAQEGLPAVALIDGDRLRQALINLLGNALKFTEAGAVTLRLRPGAQAGAAEIEVEDTGPGLDDEAQAILFQRFTQIDGSMTRRHGGTGLGLAISRGVAEAMGGSLGVTSAPGAGACFRLTVPAPAAELPTAAAGGAGGSVCAVRVLVVDDNGVNRELARCLLEAAGAEVTEAGGGAQALEQLALVPVDVVLMDLRMPGLDGRQALARLRRTPGPNMDVPVLAFTADADVTGDLSGFDGLVRKPIEPMDMLSRIAAAVGYGLSDEAEGGHVAA